MKPSFLLCLSFAAAFLLYLYPAPPVSAQTNDSCPFSFELQYMGEGNCFRVVMRNNDIQRMPYNVVFTVVDDSVWFAGGLNPSRLIGSIEQQSWYFRDYQPLAVGMSDTGYLCLVAAVPTARIALVWLDGHRRVLCNDTVQVDFPRPDNACVEVSWLDLNCFRILNQEKDSQGSLSALGIAGTNERVPIHLSLSLKNRTGKEIASFDMVGPGCDGAEVTIPNFPHTVPISPGGTIDISLGDFDPWCFEVDSEIGWKIESVRFIYYDAADSVLCVDTITFLFDKFSCFPGSVAESAHSAESSLNLRFIGMKSGETTIAFTLEKRTDVRLWLADMNGRIVAVAIDDQLLEAGTHTAMLERENLPSGTYLCVLQAGEERENRLVQIVK